VSLVLDSSATLAWYFEDERTDAVTAVLRQVGEIGAVVPALWRLEVANGLQMAVRKRRIDAAYRDGSLRELRALEIVVDPETDTHAWADTLTFAHRFDLTLYDAAYLELARRLRLPLASLDAKLRSAASAMGIALLGLAP
jgi:predicted nucleic acid-binding protein